jgi:hypothetical protein
VDLGGSPFAFAPSNAEPGAGGQVVELKIMALGFVGRLHRLYRGVGPWGYNVRSCCLPMQ